MKYTVPLWISGGLLTAAGFLLLMQSTEQSTAVSASAASPAKASTKSSGDRTRNQSVSPQSSAMREILAARGHLWEPGASTPAQARRHSVPVRKEAFAQIRQSKKGDQVQLNLSPQIPVLDSRITNASIQNDGTRVTHLHIPGQPEGELIIQENETAGFFLAQLYYENDPIAYEFRETDEGLVAKRHAVSDLICSVVGDEGDLVAMGLPKPEIAEGGMFGGGLFGGGGNAPGRTISISSASGTEGTGGTSALTFTLNLSSPDVENVISVFYTTSDGSATASSDYTATAGTAIFPIGSSQTTISIPLNPDSEVEGDETLAVILLSSSGAAIASNGPTDRVGIGTIFNDDLGATLSAHDITTNEGDSGATIVDFTVTLSEPAANPVTVDYATGDGSALAGSDYVASAGTLTFLTGETTKQVSVQVLGDTDFEVDEDFSLLLSNAIGAPIDDEQASCVIFNDDSDPSGVPVHHSLPGATAVAYLDMDGHTTSGTFWNGGNTIIARGIVGTLSQSAMTEIWKRVSEDFAPFQLNVTTDEAAYLAAPPEMRIRCVITPDNEWYGSAGGVAYVRSFTWTGDTPCWTFSDKLGNSKKNIAEATSHEIGHTLGLRHDGRTSPSESYYTGHGSGETGWAPIMGIGYYKSLVQWSKGEYLAANKTEDDLALISAIGYQKNNFGYRLDDHGNSSGSATPLDHSGSLVSGSGLIEKGSDTDVFSFTVTTAGIVNIDVKGSSPSSNLDILAEIRDSSGALVVSDNVSGLLNANPVTSLNPGTYYLHVSGTGKGDPLGTGYTDYGSLGHYTISGQTP